MADKMRLTDGVNTVDFSPRPGYDAPEDRRRSVHKALDGTLYIYEWSNKQSYNIPVSNIDSTDTGYIESWWQDTDELTFTPDLGSPGTTYTIQIVNSTSPLQKMFPHWDIYEGELILREA